jgi:glyoxylase-like metal-dependent hydrolase (beta-lactamase superfamily II)
MEEIMPNVYRIVVPLPRNPLKEVNSYVLTSKERNLIIDTGMNRPECIEAFQGGLEELKLDLDKTDFMVTHLHADHLGLVATFIKDGAKVYMGEGDSKPMRTGTGWGSMGDYAGASGFPESELEAALSNHPGAKYGPQAMMEFTILREGDTLNVGEYTLRAIETPGHSYGHVCLYEPNKKVLFSGDHVLGDITPNIQAWSDDQDPLDLYITSLKKVLKMEIAMILPGHRTIIQDGKKRINELIEHHRVRANEVVTILARGRKNAYQTAAEMKWDIKADSWEDFPVSQKWFATGEAIAHLRYLEGLGLIQRETVNGRIIYSTDGKKML